MSHSEKAYKNATVRPPLKQPWNRAFVPDVDCVCYVVHTLHSLFSGNSHLRRDEHYAISTLPEREAAYCIRECSWCLLTCKLDKLKTSAVPFLYMQCNSYLCSTGQSKLYTWHCIARSKPASKALIVDVTGYLSLKMPNSQRGEGGVLNWKYFVLPSQGGLLGLEKYTF